MCKLSKSIVTQPIHLHLALYVLCSDSMPPAVQTDRGWAWVVLAASMANNFLTGALCFSIGVIHVGLLRKYKESVTVTAWVGGLFSSLGAILGESRRLFHRRWWVEEARKFTGASFCVAYLYETYNLGTLVNSHFSSLYETRILLSYTPLDHVGGLAVKACVV